MAEVDVVMLGGKRVGKSTILAAIIDAFNNSAKLSSYLVCKDTTPYEKYSGHTIDEKRDSLKQLVKQRSDNSLFMTQTMADSKIQKYSISVRLPERPGQLTIDFYDVPGEFANPKKLEFSKEMTPLIAQCDVFVIAIDTPYLMEAPQSVNHAYNRIGDLEVALQNIICKDDNDIKQILLVPVKCEKWASEGKLSDVVNKIKSEYKVLIETMSAYPGMNVSILPIETVGGIHFHSFYDAKVLMKDGKSLSYACRPGTGNKVHLANGNEFELVPPFHMNDDKQSIVDGIRIPNAWYHKTYMARYAPKNCEQPALHILRFLVKKAALYQRSIKEDTGVGGFFRGLWNSVSNWWKGLEYNSFSATIVAMEENGLINDNSDGAELLHRCKKWEDAVC